MMIDDAPEWRIPPKRIKASIYARKLDKFGRVVAEEYQNWEDDEL